MEFLQGFGIHMIQALQTLSPVLDDLIRFFSSIGTPGFFLLLIPLLYWVVETRLGKTALLAFILNTFLGLSSKQLLHQPRPYWLGLVLHIR
jgi:hypothetical protein